MKLFLAMTSVVFTLSCTTPAPQTMPPTSRSELDSLVAAERAFARTSVEKGVRESFMRYFADGGINFVPHPVNTQEYFRKRTPPVNPLAATLDWEPIYADISAAGDMGYTTGPSTLVDNTPEKKPTRHFFFFSVWKKQANGEWKVVLDAGIDTPGPYTERALKTGAARAAYSKGGTLDAEKERLFALERSKDSLSSTTGYLSMLADDARLHRSGVFPLVGKNHIATYLGDRWHFNEWAPMGGEVATSNDLAYTYGRYALSEEMGKKLRFEEGYYSRVWKRDANGLWKIVLDTQIVQPPEQK